MNIKLGRTNLLTTSYFILFLLLCVAYYFACNYYFIEIPGLFNYVNYDHNVYLVNIRNISDGSYLLALNNDLGISFLYLCIFKVFSALGVEDVIIVPFIFNLITLIVIYFTYIKVCDKLLLNGVTKYFFFLGLQLLYFTQLINKDLLTLFFFLAVLNLLIDKNIRWIFILSILFFFVRIQLLIFGVLAIYLSSGNFKRRLFVSYVITSILGAIISVKADLISSETLGGGFSSFLIEVNTSYFYMGYLIFNPLRVVQFIADIYLSFVIYTDGFIDIAKILRLPLLIAMLFFIRPIFYAFTNLTEICNTKIKPVIIILLSFTLTWLMNPTINARYVMLIVPFLLILGRFVQLNRRTYR